MNVVKQFKSGTVYMGRLDYGSDIIQSLESFCQAHQIESAWVNLMGALSKATLSYYNQVTHQYVSQTYNGEYEIVSCSGNISLKSDQPMAHLHMVLSDTKYGCVAGHLVSGSTQIFACEFVLHQLEGEPYHRLPDSETGLTLWS